MERILRTGAKESDVDEVARLAEGFISYWESRGYSSHPNGYPLSKAPKNLLLMNSTIAPYIDQILPHAERDIDDVLLQKCVRLNSLGENNLLTSEDWPTSFVMGGIVTTQRDLGKVIKDVYTFFALQQAIPASDLNIIVDPNDMKSRDALHRSGISLNQMSFLNSNGDVWVTWQFGRPGPRGQGITFSLNVGEGDTQSDDGQFLNIIHIDEYVDKDGNSSLLKKPVIDVGFGFERFVNLRNNMKPFDTHFYTKYTDLIYPRVKDVSAKNRLRVLTIADNIRTLKFMLDEGILPDNKAQGYLARRLARNIFLQIYLLHCERPHEIYANAFNLDQRKILESEMEAYNKVLQSVEKIIKKIKPEQFSSEREFIAFLKDTHGIPEELSEIYLRQHN